MAKILVADDNSNVQKTVALALADLGVEVFAVNNGEAAVRKLADVSPDLVLADIFMPVRNGYEVCEYVKKDPRFSHVPVVLLVGAFDPLDEREAQRVGADGILKKPFVPPDPLITMVKTLLDRALGDRLVAVAASKPAISMQGKAGGVATAVEHPSAPETLDELPLEEFRPPIDLLSFGEGERPIAFGQLLETPVQESSASGTGVVEPIDDEQILTSSRDASLGNPVFWKTDEPEPEPEGENSEAEEDISSGISMRPWNPDADEADILQPVEPFELVRDEKDEETGQTSTIVESSASILQDAASQASLTVEAGKPEDLAANPIEWMDSVLPRTSEETPVVVPELSAAFIDATDSIDATNDATETDELQTVPEPVAPEFSGVVVAPVSVSTPEPVAAVVAPVSVSTPEPAAAVVAPVSVSMPEPAPAPEQLQPKIADEIPDPLKTHPSLRPLAQSAEDTVRSIPKQDWADLAASLQPKPIEPVAEKVQPESAPVSQTPAVTASSDQPSPENSAPLDSPDPALVEAVVQRVLDKMRPQVVDIITKEFLRPVVQALVHREIKKL